MYARLLLIALVFFTIGSVEAQTESSKSSQGFLSLAKKIIREGAIIGLDEAGSRIAGPTAWRYVKKVMAPVVEELEKRYPKLLLVGEKEAKDAADLAVKALSTDIALQKMLSDSLSRLDEGQQEILAALARQNHTLQNIGNSLDEGFKKTSENQELALDKILAEFKKMELKFEDVRKLISPPPKYAELSIHEIHTQANTYQQDALKWISARDAKTASQRLAEGRNLLLAGLKRDPKSAYILVSLGFIEKTQAQVSMMQGDYDTAETILAEAAKYFVEAMKQEPKNFGAINGTANIYYYARDFNRAINLGFLLLKEAPTYGAAVWDLSLALEGKLAEVGGPASPLGPHYITVLKEIYQYLEELMPQQPRYFSATDMAHVQKRLSELGNLSSE